MLQRRLGMSERRACRLVGQHRSTQRHIPVPDTPADPDVPLRDELRSFASKHPRWGHRRAKVHVREQGYEVNRSPAAVARGGPAGDPAGAAQARRDLHDP